MPYSRGYARRVHKIMDAIFEVGKDGLVKPISSVTHEAIAAEERSDLDQTLAIMAQMGQIELTGAGPTLAFRVTPEGSVMYQSLKGV